MKLAIICSLILSIIHSILFFGESWGISVLLFTISAVFLFIFILSKNGKIKTKKPLVLSIPIILLSATYLLFNNLFFNILNVIVIISLFLIMIIWACLGEFKPNKLLKNMWILFFAPVTEVSQVAKEFSNNFHVEKKEGKKEKNPITWKIIKALLISFPIVIIVIALLVAADETFGVIFKDIINSMFELSNSELAGGDYNPVGARASKIAEKLRKYKEKIASDKGQVNKVAIFSRYISILTVGLEKNMNDFNNYTVFQLMDEFKRYQKKQSFDMYVQAKMAGAKDLEEVDNWMDDIHS